MFDYNAFIDGYFTCAAWAGPSEEDEAIGTGWSEDAIQSMLADCRNFADAYADDLAEACSAVGYSSDMAGHDFFLTRNGHGAGYWDRGLGEVGERLSNAARAEGSADVLVDPDTLLFDHLS